MSVVEKDLLFDDDVLALGGDRVGLLARLAYVAALANKHVTASDGTLPYADSVVRLQLLPDLVTSEEEREEIRQRLARALIVPYPGDGKPFAFVAKWWRFNERPDKAVRGAKNPPIPLEILGRHPAFAEKYGALPEPSSRKTRARKKVGSGKLPERAGNGGKLPPPDPDPEAETAAASHSSGTQQRGTGTGNKTTSSSVGLSPAGTEEAGQGGMPPDCSEASTPANGNGSGAQRVHRPEVAPPAWLAALPAEVRSAIRDCKTTRERRGRGQGITQAEAKRIEAIWSSRSDPRARGAVLERLRGHFEAHPDPSGDRFLVEETNTTGVGVPGRATPRTEAA